MSSHVCLRCGNHFSDVSNLRKHLLKPRPCEALSCDIERGELLSALGKAKSRFSPVVYKCDYCKSEFSAKSSKDRHMQERCRHRRDTEGREELAHLRETVKLLSEKVGSSSIVNHNTTNNQHITINFNVANSLRAFGDESMSHITAENLRKAIEDACPIAGISKLIRSVPENQNIYHPNKQAKTLQVFDGERFVEHATDQAYLQELLRMIDRAQALMGEFRMPRRLETCLLNWVYDLRDVIVTDDLDEKRLKLQRLQELDSDDEDIDKDERRSALVHAKATLESLRQHIHSISKSVKPLVGQKEVISID